MPMTQSASPTRYMVLGFRLALLTVAIVVMYLATTDQSIPGVDDLDDKFSHILAFGALSFLLDFSWPNRRFDLKKTAALLAFGIFIEIVQYFLPYREAAVTDVVADAVGIAAYLLVAPLLRHIPILRLRWV
jgi:VanZ family protein